VTRLFSRRQPQPQGMGDTAWRGDEHSGIARPGGAATDVVFPAMSRCLRLNGWRVVCWTLQRFFYYKFRVGLLPYNAR